MKKLNEIEINIAKLVHSLPPLPEDVDILLRKDHIQSKYEIITGIAKNDPGLCADLLQMANSCFLDLGNTVDSIEQAIDIVGLEPFGEFIAVNYATGVLREHCTGLKNWDDYILHSQAVARACPILAGIIGLTRDECEFYTVAGLLHDMGRVVIYAAAGEFDASLLGTSYEWMLTVLEGESKVMGMNHCQVGMQMCRQWHLSPILQGGVERHHTPLVDDDFSFPGALIFLAHFVTWSDITGEIVSKMLPGDFLPRLGLKTKDLDRARDMYEKIPDRS